MDDDSSENEDAVDPMEIVFEEVYRADEENTSDKDVVAPANATALLHVHVALARETVTVLAVEDGTFMRFPPDEPVHPPMDRTTFAADDPTVSR